MKLNLSMDNIEHYIFLFGIVMFLISFLTLEIDLSIIDVIGIIMYLLGKTKMFPGLLNSILKGVGLIAITIIGVIVVIIGILLLSIII